MDDLDVASGAVPRSPRDEGLPPRRRRRRLRRRELSDEQREHRRLRIRRHGRRAYIRSVYSLPSLATLGNAICGFASIWIATFDARIDIGTPDHWTRFLVENHFLAAAYLIFIAMLFDALDGRLARFARHTTDFGGQLDSLADAISFGAAPAFLALQLFHAWNPDAPPIVSRIVWAAGALYFSCAIIRLARFNVSNEHGEQHHFSFLGLPSPGAASVVAAWVLMQQDLAESAERTGLVQHPNWQHLAAALVWCLPPLVLFSGLLMVSTIRYPHLVNRYLRGRRSIGQLLGALIIVLLLIAVQRYTLAIGTLLYAFMGPVGWGMGRIRRRNAAASSTPPPAPGPAPAVH